MLKFVKCMQSHLQGDSPPRIITGFEYVRGKLLDRNPNPPTARNMMHTDHLLLDDRIDNHVCRHADRVYDPCASNVCPHDNYFALSASRRSRRCRFVIRRM